MLIANGIVHIRDTSGIDPGLCTTSFRDETGTQIVIYNQLLVRLYECLKTDFESKGIHFDEYMRFQVEEWQKVKKVKKEKNLPF